MCVRALKKVATHFTKFYEKIQSIAPKPPNIVEVHDQKLIQKSQEGLDIFIGSTFNLIEIS